MTTIKTYQEDVYLKELTAIVFDVTYENGVSSIICDRTIFFPTGGGQPCDIGYINDFKIYDVSENKDGLIIHRTTDISDEEAGMELLGTEVNMKIDWSRRFRNMQRHLGEHLLSGSFYKLFGGTNKGFHMGEDYITIDIALPDGLMTESMIFKAELDANKVIQENLPVSVHYFKNSKEAGVMPVRKAIDIDGPISVVMAGNAEKTADCVACCGTHPSHTGEVGLIKIYKFEPNKGMTRIYFDAGMDALKTCIKDMNLLKTIGNHFSCNVNDLPHTLEVRESNELALKNKISKLVSVIISNEVDRIVNDITINNISGVYEVKETELDADRCLKLGFKLFDELKDYPNIKSLLIIFHTENNTLILLSDGTIKCGDLVKNHAKSYNGKGGGRNDNARAKFENFSDSNSFIDKIKSVIIN